MRAAFVLLAACWTGPAPTEPAPPPAIVVPKVRRPPAPPRPPAQLALELGGELRSQGASLLATLVDGPLVVLDLDTATTTTLCGGAAIAAAQTWGAMLADPARRAPNCYPTDAPHYFCRQATGPNDPVVMLDVVHDEVGFRLVSAVTGIATSSAYSTLHTQILQMKAMAETATCP